MHAPAWLLAYVCPSMAVRCVASGFAWCASQDSEDIRYMVGALEALGVQVEADWAAGTAVVHGCAGRFPKEGAELFLGNAGTAMR